MPLLAIELALTNLPPVMFDVVREEPEGLVQIEPAGQGMPEEALVVPVPPLGRHRVPERALRGTPPLRQGVKGRGLDRDYPRRRCLEPYAGAQNQSQDRRPPPAWGVGVLYGPRSAEEDRCRSFMDQNQMLDHLNRAPGTRPRWCVADDVRYPGRNPQGLVNLPFQGTQANLQAGTHGSTRVGTW